MGDREGGLECAGKLMGVPCLASAVASLLARKKKARLALGLTPPPSPPRVICAPRHATRSLNTINHSHPPPAGLADAHTLHRIPACKNGWATSTQHCEMWVCVGVCTAIQRRLGRQQSDLRESKSAGKTEANPARRMRPHWAKLMSTEAATKLRGSAEVSSL